MADDELPPLPTDTQPSPFRRGASRRKSVRVLLNSSFRKTRQIFGGGEDEEFHSAIAIFTDSTEENITAKNLRKLDYFRLNRISCTNYLDLRDISDDKIFPMLKPIKTPAECYLMRFFPKEGKCQDMKSNCRLTSFERKRRSHQVFGADHHAKEQLFCPLQATQVELQFRTQQKTDVIIRVQAPNGDISGYINPKPTVFTSYNPSNIGCGHGTWLVHVAVRQGCRFVHERTNKLELIGQGIINYEIDSEMRLRQVDKLWLDCLN